MTGALYRHHKGGLYRLLMDATDEATMAQVVVYRSEETGRVWVRPLVSWRSYVHAETPDGKATRIPRFERVP